MARIHQPVSAPSPGPPAPDVLRRRLLVGLATLPAVATIPEVGGGATDLRPAPGAADFSDLQHLLTADEVTILSHASLAPSGHNAQPWFVRVIDRGHWTIGLDRRRTLHAVDPANREATLSIGAFLENLVVSAGSLGYAVDYVVPLDAPVGATLVDLRLGRAPPVPFPIERLEKRRTVRAGYGTDTLRDEDLRAITDGASQFAYFARGTRGASYLAEMTIEANRRQALRGPAQEELANWIRWSKADQQKHRNGLTPAGMEIGGIAGLYARLFYDRASVLTDGFREAGIRQVIERVGQGSGWLVLTGAGDPASLVETGRVLERMWLRLRERGIAIHPMTQILEESPQVDGVARELGVDGTPQFVLRIGVPKSYPDPVSPRMPVGWFTTAA